MHYIYMITNKVNNKKYIGMRTYNGEDILNDSYMGSGKILRQAFKKYGIENFEKTILEVCTKENVHIKEKEYIEKFNAIDDNTFYNIAPGGRGGRVFKVYKQGEHWHSYGRKLSNDTKDKISKINKGKKRSDEFCKLMKNINTGKKHSEETIEKIKNSNTGKTFTDEHKRKISESNKASKPGIGIIVTLIEDKKLHFKNQKECANYFNVHEAMISYWKQGVRVNKMKKYNIVKVEKEM